MSRVQLHVRGQGEEDGEPPGEALLAPPDLLPAVRLAPVRGLPEACLQPVCHLPAARL